MPVRAAEEREGVALAVAALLVDAGALEKVDLLGPTKSCNGVLDASPYTFLSGGNGGKQSLSGSSQQINGRRTEAFPRVPRAYPRGAS